LLTDKPLRDLLAAFASTDPTPGGGSASAVASAIGASLLMMVAGLPKTRAGSDDDRAALAAAAAALTALQQQLTEAVDLDTAAYDQVVAAYKLAKSGEAEQNARTAAIQRALRGATDVPLGVMRLSAMALKQAEVVAAHGHRAASSDVGVAVALLGAGFRGARLNVEINLGSLSDQAYVEAVKGELERLEKETGFAQTALRAAPP
jgi:formiminotetrahydrofolate cyclodeaminase